MQGGLGSRPTKRWSSWYDDKLVVRKGEDILTRYDTWGIAELKRLQMVWSSWSGDRLVSADHEEIPDTPGWGVRKVTTRDPGKLRLFFLSLLWRAAASQRWEFAEISMPPEHLEQLRLMLLRDDPGSIDFYPSQLTQLSTKGAVHNMTPIAAVKKVWINDGQEPLLVPTFRFYMDGLAVHMTRQQSDTGNTKELGSLIVGNEVETVLSTVTYERSFQKENLEQLITETMG